MHRFSLVAIKLRIEVVSNFGIWVLESNHKGHFYIPSRGITNGFIPSPSALMGRPSPVEVIKSKSGVSILENRYAPLLGIKTGFIPSLLALMEKLSLAVVGTRQSRFGICTVGNCCVL